MLRIKFCFHLSFNLIKFVHHCFNRTVFGEFSVMPDCGACLKSLKNIKIKSTCSECKQSFHPKCVNLSNDDVKFIIDDQQVWRCEPCSKVRRQSMKMETAEGKRSYEDVFTLFSELKDDFKRVEVNLGTSLNACHEEITETKAIINAQRERIDQLLKIVEELRAENSTLRKTLAQAEERIDEAEQYSRRNAVEIHGVPYRKGEDVLNIVKVVGRALDYPVEDVMVDACHRLRSRDGSDRPPGIIVKMVRRIDAEGLLHKRRVKRNFNSHDLGMTDRPAEVVYVSESLTAARRRLLNAARQAKREKSYTYLWVRGGKILMRKAQGDPVKVVTSMDSINGL